ncbi:hypothetical protein AgCh_038366 [Apium graveolens]
MLDASLSPDKEPLPDYRASDPKLLGAKYRILRSLLTRTPVDSRDRAPKAHTRFHPTSSMRTPIDYRRRSSIIRHTPGASKAQPQTKTASKAQQQTEAASKAQSQMEAASKAQSQMEAASKSQPQTEEQNSPKVPVTKSTEKQTIAGSLKATASNEEATSTEQSLPHLKML